MRYFYLKNCKNRTALEAPSPEPLASGGWGGGWGLPTPIPTHSSPLRIPSYTTGSGT